VCVCVCTRACVEALRCYAIIKLRVRLDVKVASFDNFLNEKFVAVYCIIGLFCIGSLQLIAFRQKK
jgi:hypothetical protein